MNTIAEQGTIAPEVQEFLAAVRGQLADLDPEEQREILDGLEADLTDLVAERGGEALGDPTAYARELRTAAGLEPVAGRSGPRVSAGERVHGFLDTVRREWGRLVAALPGDARGFLEALQPVWWVLRAWIAAQTAALWLGDWALTVIPGESPTGAVALAAAVAFSIQLGRRRLWPAERWRRVAALRVVVLAVNVGVLAAVPAVLNGFGHSDGAGYTRGYRTGVETGYANGLQEGRVSGNDKAGLYLDGHWVSQIYPYDAQGRPLVGVQLFDQTGKPINVITQPEYQEIAFDDEGNEIDANGNPVDPTVPRQPLVYYPWTNGAAQLLNVFPIPSRLQDSEEPSATAFSEQVRPAIAPYPFGHVPGVSLPGIKTGRHPVQVAPAVPVG